MGEEMKKGSLWVVNRVYRIDVVRTAHKMPSDSIKDMYISVFLPFFLSAPHYRVAKVRCVRKTSLVLSFLSDNFDALRIPAHISLLADFAIMEYDLLDRLISQSKAFEFLRTSAGDVLEIPLVVNERRFSLQERVCLYKILEENDLSFTSRSWRVFCNKIAEIDNLCESQTDVELLVSKSLNSGKKSK
jgi:hypothetical protein